MKLLDREEYGVIRAVLKDAVDHEGGEFLLSDDKCAVVKLGDWHKCVFDGVESLTAYARKTGMNENVCVMGMPQDLDKVLNVDSVPCKTFAYVDALPPSLGGLSVKRLAHTLAAFVADKYDRRGCKTSEQDMREIMKDKGAFGAFIDSKLAGFIGRHHDGSMGMLTVFDEYKRQGIGAGLEKFLINYVMTFGRTPYCDVYVDNAPSLCLQEKMGLKPALGYTFWIDKL